MELLVVQIDKESQIKIQKKNLGMVKSLSSKT